ncbi:putative transporter small subunit [Streptomyces sp. LHD-70]|nr:putative transporter small subunit [Streptomyces sp. LHD-70]MDQ8706097.1 putative transporter small subunit [Streptomyces sp. LHD-70]
MYILIWPVIVAGVLYTICRGFVREWLEARRKGQHLI